jgi:hypothetical protein
MTAMSAATTTAPSSPDRIELFELRDELAQTYNPVNAHERMLVTAIAQSWIRLERARELERRYFEGQDMLEVIRTKLAEFKAVTRFVTDCERAWRHAALDLEKSQRRRQRPTLASPRARRAADRPAPPAPASVLPPATPSVPMPAEPRRE